MTILYMLFYDPLFKNVKILIAMVIHLFFESLHIT